MHDAFSGSVTMTLMRQNDQPTKSAMTLQSVEKPVGLHNRTKGKQKAIG